MSRGRDRRHRWERSHEFIPAEWGTSCPPGWSHDVLRDGWARFTLLNYVTETFNSITRAFVDIGRTVEEATRASRDVATSFEEAS